MPKLHSLFVALGIACVATPIAAEGVPLYLPDPAFAPEGIAASADGTLYLGSITQGRLVQVDTKTQSVNEFASAGANGMVSVIGTHVTADDSYVFACSSDPGSSALTGTAAPALVRFERATGNAAGRFELPEGGVFCNDLTELPDGTILATDSFVPRIYALRPGSDRLEIWYEDAELAAQGFNFNGIAHDGDAVYLLRYGSGELHRIALKPGGAAGGSNKIALPVAVPGADGLTALGNGRFLIVSGGGLTAGSRGALYGVTLTTDGKVSVDKLAGNLDVPTTVAVSGAVAYVVEGQLDHLFDAEAAGPAEAYRILAVELPEAYR